MTRPEISQRRDDAREAARLNIMPPELERFEDGFVGDRRLRFRILERPTPALLILEVEGQLGCESVPLYELAFKRFLALGIRRVILDCSGLNDLNSTGLGSFVKHADGLRLRGGAMVLFNLPPKVRVVLDMLGLEAFFDLAGSLEEALARFELPFVEPCPPVFPDRHPPFLDGAEPLFDWEYFVRERPGGEREGVLIHAALRDQAPMARRPILLALRAPFEEPNDQAILCPPAEAEAFELIQQTALCLFSSRLDALLTSRRADRRGITWVFYARRRPGDGLLRTLYQFIPSPDSRRASRTELWDEEDPGWHQYFAVLRSGIDAERLLARV